MKVVNLFGGPGVGKSTTAAGLFFLMKQAPHEVELVTEYAKELVWAKRESMFRQQHYVFAKQSDRLERLRGKVDWVVTDAPLLLSIVYGRETSQEHSGFEQYVNDVSNSHSNVNIFLHREKPYNASGRTQTAEQAISLDAKIFDLLVGLSRPFHWVKGNEHAPWTIYELITGTPHRIPRPTL